MGAWIEIYSAAETKMLLHVAPLVGAWIEITKSSGISLIIPSLPSWERGLKSGVYMYNLHAVSVAPLVGAWIEIPSKHHSNELLSRRSPRGSVD